MWRCTTENTALKINLVAFVSATKDLNSILFIKLKEIMYFVGPFLHVECNGCFFGWIEITATHSPTSVSEYSTCRRAPGGLHLLTTDTSSDVSHWETPSFGDYWQWLTSASEVAISGVPWVLSAILLPSVSAVHQESSKYWGKMDLPLASYFLRRLSPLLPGEEQAMTARRCCMVGGITARRWHFLVSTISTDCRNSPLF